MVLGLDLSLTLTLVLAFLSSRMPPLACCLGVWPFSSLRTPWKPAQKKFPPYLRLCAL
jgi:hypothetical protein